MLDYVHAPTQDQLYDRHNTFGNDKPDPTAELVPVGSAHT